MYTVSPPASLGVGAGDACGLFMPAGGEASILSLLVARSLLVAIAAGGDACVGAAMRAIAAGGEASASSCPCDIRDQDDGIFNCVCPPNDRAEPNGPSASHVITGSSAAAGASAAGASVAAGASAAAGGLVAAGALVFRGLFGLLVPRCWVGWWLLAVS